MEKVLIFHAMHGIIILERDKEETQMKKYNRSKIMKRAWELVKKAGLTISSALKKAWKEAKRMIEKIEFAGNAKIAKMHNGETNPYIGTEYDSESNYLYFDRWEKYGKKRIYVNDYKGRAVAYIDCNNDNEIVTDFGSRSEEVETINHFIGAYVF